MLLNLVLVAPGDQGPPMTGTQGAGVGVPMAAEVAAATAGLDCVVHMMKLGRLLTSLSLTVAAGTMLPVTMLAGVTSKLQGPVPIVH